jgi:hypothetical protein
LPDYQPRLGQWEQPTQAPPPIFCQEEQLALKIQTVRRVIDRVDLNESIPEWVDKTITTMGWIGAALCVFGHCCCRSHR